MQADRLGGIGQPRGTRHGTFGDFWDGEEVGPGMPALPQRVARTCSSHSSAQWIDASLTESNISRIRSGC